MPRGLYSDPYVKSLVENEPKLAAHFFEVLAHSEYVVEETLISCLETPGWVLERAGVVACKNPNFPIEAFERFLGDDEILTEKFWSIFESPLLSESHIAKLMKHQDLNVQGLALAHAFGDPKRILEYMQSMISRDEPKCYILRYLCQTAPLDDDLFNFLLSVHDFDVVTRTVGQALHENESLNSSQRAKLAKLGIAPKPDDLRSFWGEGDHHFLSSIPYFQLFKASFYFDSAMMRFKSIPKIDPKIERFFSRAGHHLSLLLSDDAITESEVGLDGLIELASLQLLNRLLWTELCQRDDFEINRRNAYRTDDLFISHSILGREFEETDSENATGLGGVFIYSNQDWLLGDSELSGDRAAHELGAYEESMTAIAENSDCANLGQSLIALTFTVPDLADKYGFELTDKAEDWMIDAAIEFADSDSFDVTAQINSEFGEMLSWSKLPNAKKEQIVEFLALGSEQPHSKLRNDAIHFLGCVALHEATPRPLLEKLAKLQDSLVDEVLVSRNK